MFPTEAAEGFVREVTGDLIKGTVVSFTINETIEGFIHEGMLEATKGLRVKLQELDITEDVNMGINMVELTQKSTEMEVDEESLRHEEYNKTAYPKREEDLVEFLHRCQRKRSEVMLCLRCNSVFDRKAAENIEGVRLARKGRNWRDSRNIQASDDIWDPRRGNQKGLPLQANKPSTYRSTTKAPRDTWTKPVRGRGQDHQKW